MWFFRRHTSLRERGIFRGLTDWHSHILPGVDDGVQTMDDALSILRGYEELRVTEVWLTPHVMEDIPNTTEGLLRRFAELQAAYTGGLRLHLAAEYMLDNLFEQRLEAGDLLPLGTEGDHLLVETSYFNPPMGLLQLLQRIRSKGYTPVLAHPERYMYMQEQNYCDLKLIGTKFQLNLFALTRLYGKQVQAKAEKMQKHGWYEYVGTDMHSPDMFRRIML